MKKSVSLTLMIVFSLTLSGCRWNDHEHIERDRIIGKWSLYQINDKIIPTDSTYCIVLAEDGSGLFAACTPDKHWNTYDRKFTYNESTRRLSLEGEYFHKQCNTVFQINYNQGQMMKLNILSMSYDGIAKHDNSIVMLRRLENLPREKFIGLWEGYEIDNDNGRILGDHRRWEYFDDGSFNYYHEKIDDRWVLKDDNDGHFFLYGDFLATSYQNDISEGTTGYACECWYISIDGDTMNWMASRNGKIHRFRMTRVNE